MWHKNQFFWVKLAWVQNFPSRLVVISRLKKLDYPTILLVAREKRDGFIPFQRVLVWSETQIASSRIWTWLTNSISKDNNYYIYIPPLDCKVMPTEDKTREQNCKLYCSKNKFILKSGEPSILWIHAAFLIDTMLENQLKSHISNLEHGILRFSHKEQSQKSH